MTIFEPSIAHLRETGSLKWSGMETPDDKPLYGAWVAEMDFGTAPVVRDRIIRGLNDGFTGYLPYWLAQEASEAAARYQEKRYGWVVKPEWVRVASSVLGALHATIDHFTRPGSAVIVPTPAYMPFLTIPGGHGRQVIEVPSIHTPGTASGNAWKLDLEGIRAGLEAGAGLVILCNPWNPTGRSLSVEELRELHAVVQDYDAMVFSDEIHAPLTLPGTPTFTPYASLGPDYAAHTITAVAASKAWNFAGLSAAQVIIPDAQLREVWDEKAAGIARSAVPLGLLGAVSAYEDGDEWLTQVLEYVSGNLDLLDEALSGTAVDYTRPEATYLGWLGFAAFDLDECPCQLLLDDHGIATNNGKSLGSGYENWLRINSAMVRPAWEKTVDILAQEIASWPLK